jgi:hypothetical protein
MENTKNSQLKNRVRRGAHQPLGLPDCVIVDAIGLEIFLFFNPHFYGGHVHSVTNSFSRILDHLVGAPLAERITERRLRPPEEAVMRRPAPGARRARQDDAENDDEVGGDFVAATDRAGRAAGPALMEIERLMALGSNEKAGGPQGGLPSIPIRN